MASPANSAWEDRIAVEWGWEFSHGDSFHYRVFAVMKDPDPPPDHPSVVYVTIMDRLPPLVAVHLVAIHNAWWERNYSE